MNHNEKKLMNLADEMNLALSARYRGTKVQIVGDDERIELMGSIKSVSNPNTDAHTSDNPDIDTVVDFDPYTNAQLIACAPQLIAAYGLQYATSAEIKSFDFEMKGYYVSPDNVAFTNTKNLVS